MFVVSVDEEVASGPCLLSCGNELSVTTTSETIDDQPLWKRSSFCGQVSCVEVRCFGAQGEIRDSKQSNVLSVYPVILVSAYTLTHFIGEFTGQHPIGSNGQIFVRDGVDGWTEFECDGIVLRFTPEEIEAFVAGARAGEFTFRASA